jgi:hypothetical protein
LRKFQNGILTDAIDARNTSNTITLGAVEAGQVDIGKAGISTIIKGNLKSSNIDTATAGALSIGANTATSMTIGTTTSTNTAIIGATITLNVNVKYVAKPVSITTKTATSTINPLTNKNSLTIKK